MRAMLLHQFLAGLPEPYGCQVRAMSDVKILNDTVSRDCL